MRAWSVLSLCVDLLQDQRPRSQLPVPCPNSLKSSGWARAKLGADNSVKPLPTGLPPWGALEENVQGPEPGLIWDAGGLPPPFFFFKVSWGWGRHCAAVARTSWEDHTPRNRSRHLGFSSSFLLIYPQPKGHQAPLAAWQPWWAPGPENAHTVAA